MVMEQFCVLIMEGAAQFNNSTIKNKELIHTHHANVNFLVLMLYYSYIKYM